MNQRRIKKEQLIAIAVVALLAVGSAGFLMYQHFFSRDDGLAALVSVGGVDVCTIDLGKDTERFELDLKAILNVPVVLEVDNHAVRFLTSECPDQICVHAGWLSRDMDLALCMPNQTSVMVLPRSELPEQAR